MPTSSTEHKQLIKRWYDKLAPLTVVDIGPGQGTYAKLCKGKRSHWVGIEAWAPYVDQFNLNALYDEIVISDIRHTDLKSIHAGPDLVIIGDVLEHMNREDAIAVTYKLLGWGKHVLISVPLRHRDQHAVHGNWFETHQPDRWKFGHMLKELDHKIIKAKRGKVLGYILCAQ